MVAVNSFEWYDYLILAGMLAFSLGIGFYYAFAQGGQRTTKEYLSANRSLKPLPVALSILMSNISAILILGNTAEMYLHGTQQYMSSLTSVISALFCTFVFVPLFYPLGITSSFEYLDLRFKSKSVKITGIIIMIISQLLYMGLAMFSPATALEAVSGIPVWASVLVTGVVATIYTCLGGIRAVIWTDVFQAFVMIGGILAILILGVIQVGGPQKIWETTEKGGRIEFFNFDPNPMLRMTFWTTVVGKFFPDCYNIGVNQAAVQRYCALPTLKQGQLSLFMNLPLFLIAYTICCAIGLTVYTYYDTLGCDPLRTGAISSSNQLLPYYVVDALNVPGLAGLFTAVLFSGSLSSLSSSLNAVSAITWKDCLEWKLHRMDESRKTTVTKILVGLYGGVAIGTAFLSSTFSSHVVQSAQSLVAGSAGPLYGIFVLAAFFPCSNWKGALSGAWISLVFTMSIIIGTTIESPHKEVLPTSIQNCSSLGYNDTVSSPVNVDGGSSIFKISHMYHPAIGVISCVIVGLFISLITGMDRPSEQDPRLIVPVVDRLLCCLPGSLRSKLRCGINYSGIEYDDHGNYVKNPDDKTSADLTLATFTNNAFIGDKDKSTEYLDTTFRNRIKKIKINGSNDCSNEKAVAINTVYSTYM